MALAAEITDIKESRLAMRLRPDQNKLIRDAAKVSGRSLTDFVVSAAVAQAEDTLADRHLFQLSRKDWNAFCAILDRPARRIPELSALLEQSAPWD